MFKGIITRFFAIGSRLSKGFTSGAFCSLSGNTPYFTRVSSHRWFVRTSGGLSYSKKKRV